MKILIVGHTGFIGRHVVECFRTCLPETELIGVSFPQVDLCTHEGAEQVAQLLTPDTIIVMCAAVKRQLGDSLEIFRKNLHIIESICEILQQRPVKKLVYFSSSAVYAEDIHNTNITEEMPVQPRTFYGIAKYASERLLWKLMSSLAQSSLVLLRPPLVYGIGDESRGYGPAGFLDKLLRNEEIVLWGDGSELREFLYVKDVARVVYEVAHNDFGGVLDPVSGKSYSFRSVLDFLSTITGRIPRIVQRERTKEKVDNVFSNALFRRTLPDFRFTALEEGLRTMVEAELHKGMP